MMFFASLKMMLLPSVAMMRCLPQCAVRHTSLGVAVIIGEANIICRRQISFCQMMHRLRRYDVFRFAQNDVAPLRSAMMRCLPSCAVRHTSIGVADIIGKANIICRRQTSFKKRTFVYRQRCVFCWWRQMDSNHRPHACQACTLTI